MNHKNIFKCLLLAGLPFMAACNSDDTDLKEVQPLQLCVSTGVSESRAVVDGSFLPEGGQIGLSLVASDGSAYDGKAYNNIPYTATGDGVDVSQTWSCSGDVVPSLSATMGKAVAYYPYNDAEDLDITAIPIETASQTDYMYSGWSNHLYTASPKAYLTMNHAMARIRVKLYNSPQDWHTWSSVTVSSPMFGTAATLDATEGTLSDITGQGEELSYTPDTEVSLPSTADEAQYVEFLVIPDTSVTSGDLTIYVKGIDNGNFTYTVAITETFTPGTVYSYVVDCNVATD